MAGDSGYSIYTHYINPEFFISMIASDIKELIHTYGHKNCGLRQEELCDKIKKLIPEKKKLIFEHMDARSKKKWDSEWKKKRNEFFNKLYDDEGFINMCFPPKYKNNASLDQLLSRHIQFCKEKDDRLSAIGESREYSVCLEYNKWIIAEESSFTSEYLRNVQIYKINTVKKFFSTKKHPEGYDPRTTYHGIKLNCEIYNPKSRYYQPIPVENTPTNSLHHPIVHDLDQKSRGKDGRSMPDEDVGVKKTKPDVQVHLQTKLPVSDDKTSSLSNTKEDRTDNGQNADIKAKSADLPSKDQGAKGQPDEATDTKAQSPEQLPELTSSISTKDSPVPKVLDPPPSVKKNQGTLSDSTLSTISAASDAAHSAQNVPSSSAPDLSLPQSQPPAVVAVSSHHQNQDTSQFPQEPTPDPVTKSADHGTPLTPTSDPQSSLDPGLAPSKAEASSSSASGTSSTLASTTTDSIAGSPPPQDPLLITVSPQSTTTTITPIVTTPSLTQTTPVISGPATATVSAMGTKVIPSINGITSTTEGHGKPQVPIKTASDSQDPTFASSKKQDDTISPHLGAQPPGTSANLNINPSSGQTLRTPPGRLPDSPPGLSFGISPAGSVDVSPAVHGVVNHPGKYLNYNLFTQSDL
ncbi:hypothetical protein POVWA1_070300 [Plasmodium ovale wallikeri]|uniref:STP1 protein n=1 Tax=Plasmodium ovale wallikeri TaxID=864142 RepID=A0A1A9AHA7_PLAOA|nr:hypothetical protein POVWA1_070300 [Plasmodium ovale wallikeri]